MKIRLLIAILFASATVFAQTPSGETKGHATQHTPESSKAVVAGAAVVLPASITGGVQYVGTFRDVPMTTNGRVPVVVFLHGSSGLGLKAIGEWQQWLAGMGIASFAPDSFGLPDRVTYSSPVDKSVYEKIHALRGSEITLAVQALQKAPWADTSRMVLAGTSEGATAVARYTGNEFQGRIVFSWSCEDNYFVQSHMTAMPDDKPVLNVISSTDPFFSATNPWLGSAGTGHCGNALKGNKQASVVLIPGAPHTLLNLPAARHPVAGFLRDVLKP
jgi:dienelactone hydrolase